MPAKEIKELRQAGKLEEALKMAKKELETAAMPLMMVNSDSDLEENILADLTWPKRNISWVYYELLKLNAVPEHFDTFLSNLNEIKNLQLPKDEKMLFDNVAWQIGKLCFALSRQNVVDANKFNLLFNAIITFHFTTPSEGYSFLFKGFHKSLKDTDHYLQFAGWWDFKNFMPGDFQKEKMPNGKEVMAVAEQGYIAYSRSLLKKRIIYDENGIEKIRGFIDKQKIHEFLPVLDDIIEKYPYYQYPPYFKAKLLVAMGGDKISMLSALLPFAKKKRNDFWVWEILADAFSDDTDKVFACYCKALSCNSPEEMLVSLRQKMATLLISKKLYNEAKTEIDLLVEARNSHGFKIPNDVVNWQSQEWYKTAIPQKSNFGFYKQYTSTAESLLFSDTPEEMVIVEFVNTDKKMLNFIASESKFGFFKYDRFFKDVKVGDTLKVRFQGGAKENMYQLYTAIKVNDTAFKKQFLKEVKGVVKIPADKPFGFLDDVFIHPLVVERMKLSDGMQIDGIAMKVYNRKKLQWEWKLLE